MIALRRFLAGRGFFPVIGVGFVLQVGAVAYLLRRSYFFAEDFTFLQLFDGRSLTWEDLTRVIFGHLVPAFVVMNKYVGGWFGASWTAASLITIAIQLATSIAFALLIYRLAGRRWWVPLVCIASSCSVVFLTTVPWWAATITIQASLAACVATWAAATRYAHTGSRWSLVATGVAYVVALSFWEKSLAECFYLGLFALLVGFRARQGSWGDRLREALRLWPLWLVLAAISCAHLAIYLRGDYLEANGTSSTTGATLDYLAHAFGQALAPAAFGISPVLVSGGTATGVWIVASALLLAVIVWSCIRAPLAVRAWGWFALSFVASQWFVARGRLSLLSADVIAHDLRYSLDAYMLLIVAVVIAVPAAVASTRVAIRTIVASASLVAFAIVMVLWASSVHEMAGKGGGQSSRSYFTALRTGSLPAGTKLLDVAVPGSIVPPPMAPWNRLSRIVHLIDPDVIVTNDPTGAMMIRRDGSIVPVAIAPDPTVIPTPGGCAKAGGSITIANTTKPYVPFETPIVLFTYSNNQSARVRVVANTPSGPTSADGTGEVIRLNPPTGVVSSVVVPSTWTSLEVKVARGAARSVCISDVRFGTLKLDG